MYLRKTAGLRILCVCIVFVCVHMCVLCFQVQLDVSVSFAQDQLKGDNITELRVKFLRRLDDAKPAGED